MRIMIFDTETVGMSSQALLNVGYVIIDLNLSTKESKIVKKRDYLNTPLINNKMLMLNDTFVGVDKYSKYLSMLETKEIKKLSIKRIFEIMAKDITKYEVNYAFAYNSNFDIDKFNKTSLDLEIKNPLERVKVFDIMSFATNYITNKENYKEWCKENNEFTSSKSCYSQTAQSVYRYITNNLEFIEIHTALSDSIIESEILLWCFKNGCDIFNSDYKVVKFNNVDFKRCEIINVNGEEIKIEYNKKYTRGEITYYK